MQANPRTASQGHLAKVDLVKGKDNTIVVPVEVREALGIRKGNEDRVYTVEKAKEKRKLVMPGSTGRWNPSTLYRIKVRFAPCEAFEIAKVPDVTADDRKKMTAAEVSQIPMRELRSGDWVEKDATFPWLRRLQR